MKQLVILSGKGGTGKTTVTAALAHLAAKSCRIVLTDADVDAANLGLLLNPVAQEAHDFIGGAVAVVDSARCTACGRCVEVCRFDAAYPDDAPPPNTYHVDPLVCEGCAACVYECPANAITMQPQRAGQWFVADTPYGPLYHAHLFAGQENSGKLVTLVRRIAQLRARDEHADMLLIDGPPGIGRPVIAALSGADMALIVAEPTVAGTHDLKRILDLASHFRVPAVVLINKSDLNPAQLEAIAAACAARNIPVVGRLPYDLEVTNALVRREPITMQEGVTTSTLQDVWAALQTTLGFS